MFHKHETQKNLARVLFCGIHTSLPVVRPPITIRVRNQPARSSRPSLLASHPPAFNSIFISWPIFLNVRGINFSLRIIALVKRYRAVHMFRRKEGRRYTPRIGANSISINGIKTILFKTGGLNPFGALANVKSMKSLIKSPTNAAARRSFSAGFVCSPVELIIQKLTKFQMEI